MNNIRVYTTNTCPWCTKVKNYLKSKNVNYEEVNVGLNRVAAMEMVNKSGQMGVPVLDINGKIVVGFDKNRIDTLLELQ
ncbi:MULTISPECIES: glutaredoxin domain-containing protein [Clostridium]|uniref:glutaredoxin domain-containing protein n=1 Tax=Clostridium TaxID=1485 RepID=UPI001158F102|nr:glutaredoxin domain-containing protein [Clostridium sp.]MDU3349401.1 glutaredoxin domain-containing protein [Clostridium sp.]MDU3408624.1 glutaredoxin domain-containing protein [Clostridium sp.]MDU6364965.1 glutaredoxin domain-containing protein [Clostridium sp.]